MRSGFNEAVGIAGCMEALLAVEEVERDGK
jgi:hypothetical protein